MEERQYNRLINEKSPYLLQHAENPVDWYPWGDEAFERARAEDKPVFLSVGYSTCHWCHVMEHESFSDPEVAELMNASFVSIKVDREERPDIDNLYMNVCHMLNGSGGWPLTILMTPDKRPFYAGTYYPKHSMGGRIGMMELIPRIMEAWREKREQVVDSSQRIIERLDEFSEAPAGGTLNRNVIRDGVQALADEFDPAHGGFGGAPKFPMPHFVMLLLRQWHHTKDAQLLQMAERTLDAMRCGGIHDHLGGGFHRYSTDQYWRVPHFEKMLHDQALLALAYLEAHQATGRAAHAEAARGIMDFVIRVMASPEGGFYSALSADTEGEEGRFYLWREDQIRHALDGREADAIIQVFNVSSHGNFSHEATGQPTGDNVLYLDRSLDAAAESHGFTPDEVRAAMRRLFEVRGHRERPAMDDKVIADWNGMMIAALARGYRVLGDEKYLDAARRAADFVLTVMRDGGGGLLHRWREGEAVLPGMADDYAYMAWALIELYEAGFDPRHLGAAVELMDQMVERFWRAEGGGFYFTPAGGEALPVRRMETYDGAVPAANSVALYVLAQLAALTGDDRFTRRADELISALASGVAQTPSAHAMFLVGLDAHLASMRQVAVVGRPDAEDTRAMLDEVGRGFHPDASVVFVPADEERPAIREHAPYVRSYTMDDGHATAYVCIDRSCQPAVTDVKELARMLEG